MLRDIVFGVVIILALITNVAAAEDAKEKAAVVAAEKWLAVIDAGNYSESWEGAADKLKTGIAQGRWEQLLHSVREQKGKLISRKVRHRTSRSTPPNGEQVIVWFETSFQNSKAVVETVSTMLEKDGEWRVTGYTMVPGAVGRESILLALMLFLVIIGAWYVELKPEWR